MKKLLLLGGSRYLLPVIQVAHKHGFYVITCDYLPNNFAHKYSDEYANISIIDKDAVLSFAKGKNIDGIMSFACDPGVVTAAYVADSMGLPTSGPYDSVCILQNKGRFRDFLHLNGFNVPYSMAFKAYEDIISEMGCFSFPVIVKPVDSAGSKGVTKVDSEDEMREAFDTAINASFSKEVIVEEFIEQVGYASDCDSFSIEGELISFNMDNQLFDLNAVNPFVPAGYSFPSEHNESTYNELKKEIQRLISLLGMKTSIYNIEARVGRDGKAYIMECSPRGGGNRLAEIVDRSKGIHLIESAVLGAVGESINNDVLKPKRDDLWGEVIIHSEKDGLFEELIIRKEAEKYVFEKDLWVKKGDQVSSFKGANNSLGTVLLRFPSKSEMNKVMENISKHFQVKVSY